MTLSLPPMIEAYFSASNTARSDDVAAAFASDGEVRDERQIHHGRGAIAAWSRAALDRYAMRTTPLAVDGDGDAYKVAAEVTGDFPGSPLTLTHRFTLASEGIRRLEIR